MKDSTKKLLSNSIKTERARRGLTQEKMAERLHTSVRQYSRIERGDHNPSADPLLSFLYMLHEAEAGSVGELLERYHALEDK